MKKKILSIVLSTALFLSAAVPSIGATFSAVDAKAASDSATKLQAFYTKPATDWEKEATPLGNGFLGAMVFGGVESDRIQINEHSLWSGGPGANENYDGGMSDTPAEVNRQNLMEARQGLQEAMTDFTENSSAYIDPETGKVVSKNYPNGIQPGGNSEIAKKVDSLKGEKNNFGSYQSLGNIMIEDPAYAQSTPVEVTSNSLTITAGEKPEMLFDGNINTKWYSVAGTPGGTEQPFPCWVTAKYAAPITFVQYTLTSGNDMQPRDPKNWTLYGSNDGETFEPIDTQTNVEFSGRKQSKVFSLGKSVSYQYIKFEVTSNKSGNTTDGVQLSELSFDLKSSTGPSYTNYKRTLDLDNATAKVEYTLDDVNFTREYFVSNPDNFMAIRLTADQPGAISKAISITTPQSKKTITAEGDTITMTGQPADQREDGLKFAQQIKVVPQGGSMTAANGTITVEGADSVLLLMTAGTNYQQCMDDTFDYFTDEDPLDAVSQRIATVAAKDYDDLLAAHVADYQSLFNNMKLNLCDAPMPEKPTDELLAAYGGRTSNPNTALEDRYLETLYYQFGRYLLIASSRDGSLPANLQGIWADGLNPPWDADYHTNINVQMNYWLAESTNLTECHLPIVDYINSLVPRGEITAQRYHCTEDGGDVRGWTTYHENNIWGNTAPATSSAFYFPAGGAWMTQDIWEIYAFNQDKEFLAENFDTLLGAALFWVDNLVTDTRDGTLVSSPSYSPEHGPYSLGAACDQGIIWDTFQNTIEAAEALGIDTPEIAEIREAQSKLAGPQIGLAGQFMEWKDEITMDITGDGGHRHVNQLFALHPGRQVVANRSAEDDAFVEAMKVTLNTRGDGGTGWSKAWKINFWARLRDGDHAQTMVNQILKESTYGNLFDTHPPFQIDGNFGATAGMTEMLLQSQGDSIDLLAALPQAWDHGDVTGLKARGNVEVDMEWSHATLTGATLRPGTSNEALKVRGTNIATSDLKDSKGNPVEFTVENKNTIVFNAVAGETYTISNIRDEEGLANAKTELNELIASAQAQLDAKTPDYPFYDWNANNALELAIEAAQAAYNNDTVTVFELKDAIAALQAAVDSFNAAYNMSVTLSLASGIYNGKQQVAIQCASNIVEIHYTLDGSEPTINSPRYFGTVYLPYGISQLKAAAFHNGNQVGDTLTANYLVTSSTNLALKQKVSASQSIGGYGPEKAVDGDRSSRWATNGSNRTFTIDFGKDQTFNSIDIREFVENNQATRMQGYTLEAYNGTDWTVIDTYDSANPAATQMQMLNNPNHNPRQYSEMAAMFAPVTASQLRFTFNATEITLWEVEVYNSQDALDTNALEQAIADAESINPDEYVDVTALNEALAAARTELANPGSQESVNATATALRTAINELEPLPVVEANKTILKRVLDYANQAIEDGKTDNLIPSVKAIFNSALKNANSAYNNPAATQEQVDQAWVLLMNAIHMLDFQAGDKIALLELIAACDLLNPDDYQNSEAFVAALAKAHEVADDEDALATEVDAAYTALQNALNELVLKNKTQLEIALSQANEVIDNYDLYVDAGKAELSAAVEKAQGVYDNPKSTQEEIDTAALEVLEAMLNMRYKADKSILQKIVAEAASIDLSAYTPESVQNFQSAYKAAQEIADDNNLSKDDQAKVNEAAKNLQAAINSLVPVNGDATANQTSGSAKTGDTAKLPIAMAIASLALLGIALKKRLDD